MFNETHPISNVDRDVAVAASRGTLGQVAPQPETVDESTAKLIAAYESKPVISEDVVDDVHTESSAAEQLRAIEQKASAAVQEAQGIFDDAAPVTQAEFCNLKNQVNDSLGELANLLLEQQRLIEQINERLELHNQRSGHKI